jgi:hypothetical protein
LREEPLLPLDVSSDFAHVFEEERADGLGGVRHVDGAVVPHHFTHERQRTAMVQVEMRDDDAVHMRRQRLALEIGTLGVSVDLLGEAAVAQSSSHPHSGQQAEERVTALFSDQ